MTLPRNKQIIGLIAWLVVSFIAAAIGSAASIQAGPFYAQLVRPAWAPPSEVFGPVWTVLYALMGIAAWLAWRSGGLRAARTALTLFLVQLAVNALWSWLFFGWRLGALALVGPSCPTQLRVLLLTVTIERRSKGTSTLPAMAASHAARACMVSGKPSTRRDGGMIGSLQIASSVFAWLVRLNRRRPVPSS